MDIVKVFITSKKSIGLSVAEVNPDHDPVLKMTSRLVDEIVSCLEGRTKSWLWSSSIHEPYPLKL
jgi:arginase family enzyme